MPRTIASSVGSKAVGQELRDTRMHLGLSQAALARRLSVTAGYVASVESGRSNLTIGQLMNFAQAMNVGLEITFPIPADEPLTLHPRADVAEAEPQHPTARSPEFLAGRQSRG